jgi:uncharacterized protein
MGAIAVHHTAVSDGSWDAPAAKANLTLNGTEAYYSSAYAWEGQDDPTTKADYRFIHHEVTSAGAVGAANVTACSTGIAVLNGGMGGTTIPNGDRAGVHAHLAAHMMDAKAEAPMLKSARGVDPRAVYQVRSFALAEVRATEDNGQPIIEGYAAVFDTETDIQDWAGTYKESIARGAFKNSIKTKADVRALVNHDPNYILGRTKADTLQLQEDATGLHVRIQPPRTQWANDLMESMRRGDLDQMSFGFEAIKANWNEDHSKREIKEALLWDVSVVTFPAYPQTEASVRSAIAALQRYIQAPDPPAITRYAVPTEQRSDQHSDDTPAAAIAQPAQPLESIPEQEPIHSEPTVAPEQQPPLHSKEYYRAVVSLLEAGIPSIERCGNDPRGTPGEAR